ncbi:arginine--tRNA ligase [Jatrophihabitans telluris]|uniref:Arginine--tRNA ligase n=1 Tax=Jatrophihabitans telluris TaxID=2038343 RepID=A0ABY4R224_9ACTN|nr:arginine--tRNA ligase [Jatrophihabitans telluris]UQX89849.1 arginine--tRNA ligase [Jatrophihabitans telluris]
MTPADLASAIQNAVSAAVAQGEFTAEIPDEVVVDRPKNAEHGDYATNIALRLAKPAGKPPRVVAEAIAAQLRLAAGVARVDVAGPGFLNITVEAAALGAVAQTIALAGAEFGRTDTLAGQSINLEFISANPTGPLHLGHTRWAAVGDAIGRVLSAAGADVTREFYVNDRGVQMDHFGASLQAAATGRPIPEGGYHGAYIPELAATIVAEHPEVLELDEGKQQEAFREEGYTLQLAEQRQTLEGFGTVFDVWYSERELHTSGAVERALDTLKAQGHLFTAQDALWLRTTDFGDDKDRVLIKSDGSLTYFASDAAYYLDKRNRGFDLCIYLLGADHHGYVNRLRAIAACAGDDPQTHIQVLIGQLVKILRGGQEVRLSKRAGEIVTLTDFVEAAGVDAVRYSLSRYPADSPLNLDLDLITRQSSDNPVFYVQYAHARTCSVVRNAAEVGMTVDSADSFHPQLLTDETETALLTALADFPRVVAQAAELREPHRVARYVEDLAGLLHRWYEACRIMPRGDEEITDTNRTRLWLNVATRTVLANGLALLGVSAPERM